MTTPRKLEPLGKAILDEAQRMRIKANDLGKSKFIFPSTFEQILKAASNEQSGDPAIVPYIKLCYAFGLRISETQGLTREKFFADFLLIDEQGSHVVDAGDGQKTTARKGVKTDARKVPYWNLQPREAWQLAKDLEVMHPCTLNRRVNDIMRKFGHSSHDLRRTFITNSHRRPGLHWKDVKAAAGHKDVRTTMAYDQDDRMLSNQPADLD